MSGLLACPSCGAVELWSDEKATISYPAQFTEDGPTYTGNASRVFDEGTTFEDVISCTACGHYEMTLTDLVPDDAPTLHELADEPERSET